MRYCCGNRRRNHTRCHVRCKTFLDAKSDIHDMYAICTVCRNSMPPLSQTSGCYLVFIRHTRFGPIQYSGYSKTLECGFPFWVAIIMGCITGAAGGVIRDVLLNEEPVIFRKEIYAMACVVGGLTYWLLSWLQVSLYITVIATFAIVCAIRFLAVRYHISLPKLRDEE